MDVCGSPVSEDHFSPVLKFKGAGTVQVFHQVTLFAVLAITASQMMTRPSQAAPAPTGVPAYDAAMLRGIAYLRTKLIPEQGQPSISLHGGYRSLPAYALLAAGEPVTTPGIQEAITEVQQRCTSGGYQPASSGHHIYEAGVDAMLLAEANPDRYRNEITTIAQYIVAQQKPDGAWNYLAVPGGSIGDTSMAQYAVLGLWASVRAGVDVPMETWDRAAQWHVRTQRQDGGFQYHPGLDRGPGTGGNNSTVNMTAGAVGSLAICKLHLYPEATIPALAEGRKIRKRFGVLEEKKTSDGSGKPPYKPQIAVGQIDASIQRGLGWLTTHYVPISPLPHTKYYNYALERGCAMNFVTQLGGRIDWFRTAGDALLKLQKDDGSWDDFDGGHTGTSFVLLFFIRPTKQTIEKTYGAGLLTGGRGLPDDLSQAKVSSGGVKARKPEGPLDELLADLEKMDGEMLEETQAAIVEKVQLGNREDLIGQIERVRTLIKHPSAEVRRTAAWALGRSSELRDAGLLIQALDDNDISVLIEANNSLCYLSRKLSGVGIPADPLQDLPENPPQTAIEAAVTKWRKLAIERWSAWYFRVRPYADRGDVFQLQFQSQQRK